MPDLLDGESVEMKGSAKEPYLLKNTGGVYSCTCPAWRNQSTAIEQRTCKHLRKLRGDKAEEDRIGSALPQKPVRKTGDDASTAPPLLLAHSWTNDVDLAGWWMSEKLDGVRAYWDGKQFISRQGNLFHAPDWFIEHLPSTPLDGELWLDRKAFQRTVSIVRRQDKSDHWREISFLVFDAPQAGGAFEDRVKFLRDCLAKCKGKNVKLHSHELCRDVDHLRTELARVEALGGEGLMLREPGSKYESGRSTTLLKVKSFHDAEARVLEHLPGEGRHKGRLGALFVQLADGTKFSVGTGFSDAQRASPPAVGSTITFRYQELTDRGVPRFPSFVRASNTKSATPLPATAAPAIKSAKSAKGKSVAAPAKASSTKATRRYFEFEEGTSSKFWEIKISGNEVTTRYGRIGANGQTTVKTFADNAAAERFADKLIEEKTDKGYQEVDD
jgi:DNA ligase-1